MTIVRGVFLHGVSTFCASFFPVPSYITDHIIGSRVLLDMYCLSPLTFYQTPLDRTRGGRQGL